ncbi:MAG: polyprenyl synthetase family protein [marine benthic group bacterium]|jgi:octaprenyl-diphosphate synthase|nr:polyprenyl synthetase family protein [Gemmatimonadota bacterium]MCL7962332.1 polyprenyl synthetase family protein [Candidatus Carthagonibacter metallireducens]MCL7937127.1 polyprenyl synthetase family protein [Gemmatimonadota bacterium]MCL7957798.1 polyprenyl synthetase family protein [Gemmatimonadota bacterium]MCL7965349.1 polyprenyl synthetase family protein [Gemmatimonadota bacterium]
MLEAALPTLSVLQAPVRDRLVAMDAELHGMITADFGAINEVSEYLFARRGKYLRPTLLLLSNEVGGNPQSEAVRLASIVELMHVATLVHDDAVDHSPQRRGMPTVNSRWSHQVAVIMGDYLYSRALVEVTRMGDIEAIDLLANASNRMSIGEMRQLAAHDALETTVDDYFSLCDCKTASLMSAACELGALVGRAEYRESLGGYGHDLGMAFQIVDDLLDYTVSSAVTGKPNGLDLKEHKVTLPLILALPRLEASDRHAVNELFADATPSDEQVASVIDMVRGVGGLDDAREVARSYAASALERLQPLPDDPAVEILRLTVEFVLERQK